MVTICCVVREKKKHDFRVLKGLIFDIDCRTFIKNSLAVAFI